MCSVASGDTTISCSDLNDQLPSVSHILSLSDNPTDRALVTNLTKIKEEPVDADARADDVIDVETEATTSSTNTPVTSSDSSTAGGDDKSASASGSGVQLQKSTSATSGTGGGDANKDLPALLQKHCKFLDECRQVKVLSFSSLSIFYVLAAKLCVFRTVECLVLLESYFVFQTSSYLQAVCQLCHCDTDLAHHLWIDFFPAIWRVLGDRHQTVRTCHNISLRFATY